MLVNDSITVINIYLQPIKISNFSNIFLYTHILFRHYPFAHYLKLVCPSKSRPSLITNMNFV